MSEKVKATSDPFPHLQKGASKLYRDEPKSFARVGGYVNLAEAKEIAGLPASEPVENLNTPPAKRPRGRPPKAK